MINLRPYQKEIIDTARELMQQGNQRVCLQMCTGGGKTVISAWMAQSVVEKGKKALFVVRGRDLVYQAHRSYEKFDIPAAILMAGNNYKTDYPIQIASIDTIRARHQYLDWLEPDLLFVDESHESINDSYNLTRSLFPNAFEVGLTATPARPDGKGLGDIYTAMAQAPGYDWFIENGYLVQPRYVSVPESETDLLKTNKNGEYTEGSQEDAFEKSVLVGQPVKHFKQFAEGRPTILFAPSVAASLRVSEQFNEAGYSAVHIDASTPREVREAALEALGSGSLDVVCNYGVYGRGLDVPEISCVMVMREIKHLTPWIQIIGRGLRSSEGKTDCIVIDMGENMRRHRCVVQEPVLWTLDETVKADEERKVKEATEPKPLTCQHCRTVWYMKESKVCPNCGQAPQAKEVEASLPETRDVDLVFVDPKKTTLSEKAKIFGEILYYSRSKGYKDGFASHLYKEFTGTWPNKVKRGVALAPPSEDTKELIRKYWARKHIQRSKGGRYAAA